MKMTGRPVPNIKLGSLDFSSIDSSFNVTYLLGLTKTQGMQIRKASFKNITLNSTQDSTIVKEFQSWTIAKISLEGDAGQGSWTGVTGGDGRKIEIAEARCRDGESIRSLAALLETADAWTVNSLSIQSLGKSIDEDSVAISDLLSRQNKIKTIKTLMIKDVKCENEDQIKNVAFLLTSGSWAVAKVSLDGTAGKGEWTEVRRGEGGKIDIAKAICFIKSRSRSITSLAAFLDTSDSWTIEQLELQGSGVTRFDFDFDALTDLLTRQNKTKTIKSLKINHVKCENEDQVYSWSISEIQLEGSTLTSSTSLSCMHTLLTFKDKNTSIHEVVTNINTGGIKFRDIICSGYVADGDGRKKATLEITKAACSNRESMLRLSRLLQAAKSWTVETLELPGRGWCSAVRGGEAGVTASRAVYHDTDTPDNLFVCLQTFKTWTVETLVLTGIGDLWATGRGECNTVRGDEAGITVSRAVCKDDKAIQSLFKILNDRNSWTVDGLEIKFDDIGSECDECNKRPACGGNPCALHTLLASQDEKKEVNNVMFKLGS